MKLPQIIWQKKLSSSLVMACCALAVVGCSRTDETKDPTKTDVTQSQTDTAVACNSEKATAAISKYLENRVKQQATNQAQIIEQQANTAVDMTILNNNLTQMAISLENVNGSNNKCHATASFNLPQSQLDSADKIYTRLGLPVIAEQIVTRGYQLQNSTLVAKNINFGLSSDGANYQVTSTTGDDVIGVVGEIVANAALAQTLTGPTNMTTAGTPPTAIVSPTTRRDVTDNTTTKPTTTKSTSSKPATTKSSTVKSENVKKETTNKSKNDNKLDAQKSATKTVKSTTKYTTTEETRKITSASSDKNSAKSTETKPDSSKENTTKETKKVPSEKKPVAVQTTEKSTTTVTHQRVPTDSTIKLTIEEKNEQY